MEFRLLGPVEVWAAGRPVDPGRPRQRAVLSALLVDAGEVVPEHVLVDRVWGDEPPPDVGATLRAHVTRIRRVLEAAHAPARVVRRTGGYQLEVGRDLVDLHRFRTLVTEGRTANSSAESAGSAGGSLAALREAMGLWRGEPLAGVSGSWAERMRQAWAHERVDAVVEWARAEIRAGDPAAPLRILTELAGTYPHAEPLAATLIHALSALGRSADALAHYAMVRERLVEDLGADPGPELQAIHRAALRGELDRPVVLVHSVPAQLPADVSAFTGRGDELARLDEALVDADPHGTAVVISAVAGTAGVGKTALAVRWAHHARARFPDGQLFVNLRGYDRREPLPATEALAGFLSALGVAPAEIPESVDDRAARYRTEIADRRMLVVLDNAGSVEQVWPLLPGTASCAVLVTSRDSMGALVAVHGARRIDLDTLPRPDAVALLRRLIGRRADAEPDAVATLAEQCANLPLALRVAAELAATRGGVPLADLVTELRDAHGRLAVLDSGGEPGTAVTSVLSWSVRHLPEPAARTFALLGPHPCRDVDEYAVAALAGTGLGDARRDLDRLVRAHLTHRSPGGRYGMHDLLKGFAATLAGTDRDASTRLLDYYLATAAAAMDILHPAEKHRRPRVDPPATPAPSFVDGRAALRWLDAERANLVAMTRHATEHGWPGHAGQMSDTLFRYLDTGHWADALAVHTAARDAGQQVGDLALVARTLISIAGVSYHRSRFPAAVDLYEQARDMARKAGVPGEEARATANLGLVLTRMGRTVAAVGNFERALELYRAGGNRTGEARALANLAAAETSIGRSDAAAEHHRAALALFEELGDRLGAADTLTTMGRQEIFDGHFGTAEALLERSLVIYQEVGSGLGEAWATDLLGIAYTGLGQVDKAVIRHRSAVERLRELGDRDGMCHALNGLGEAALADERPRDALTHHEQAREVAVETGSREELARALTGLGRARAALGNTSAARATLERALALYLELDSPLAEGVRQRLAELKDR